MLLLPTSLELHLNAIQWIGLLLALFCCLGMVYAIIEAIIHREK